MSYIEASKILEEPVILEVEFNKYEYGRLQIDKYSSGSEDGHIVESLLQENIVIQFNSEEERNKILEIIPKDLNVSVEENSITISFEKENIEAPLYYRRQYSDSYNRSKTQFYENGRGTIQGTVRTPELEERISELKSKAHQIKAEIYKADTETYNRDRIKATSNIKEFFNWLCKTGNIEIIDTEQITGSGSMGLYGVRRSYRDENINYKFNGEDEIYTAIIPDGDFVHNNKYGERIEELYKQFVEQMKESGEYYVEGTTVPRYSIDQGNGIFYGQDKEAVMIKNGEPVLVLNDVEKNGRNKYCRDINKKSVYVSTNNNPRGYEELYLEECISGERGRKGRKLEDMNASDFYRTDWLINSNQDSILYYSAQNEVKMEKGENDGSLPEVIQLYGESNSFANETYGKEKGSCNCILMCNGKKITAIFNPGEYKDEEKITEFEYEDKIESIEVFDNYIVINNSEIIMVNGEYSKDIKLTSLKNVKNMQNVKATFLKPNYFIENEQGCFCIEGLSEQEKLELYKNQGFDDLYQKLESEIQKRTQEEEKEAKKQENEKKELKNHVYSADSLLVPVVYSNPKDNMSMNEAKIYNEEGTSTYGKYYADDENVQALYGIQEKGWRGNAYKGLIINVEMAKKLAQKGKLHFNVPEEDMGKIIGKQGSNIQYVTEKLRKKGVNVSKIILHPKTKEEMSITLNTIKENIEKNKNKSYDEI